nr:DUF5591 domain-containing protein [Candidatus Freyarchaeota archaeon]
VTRHLKKLESFSPDEETDILLILSEPGTKPFHKSREHKLVLEAVKDLPEEQQRRIQVATKSTIFGLIPLELEEVYPLSQHVNLKPDPVTIQHTSKVIERFLATHDYRKVIIQLAKLEEESFEPIRKICFEKNIELHTVSVEEEASPKKCLESLLEVLRKVVRCEE